MKRFNSKIVVYPAGATGSALIDTEENQVPDYEKLMVSDVDAVQGNIGGMPARYEEERAYKCASDQIYPGVECVI